MLTLFSGLSNAEGFFLPMFMRLLNFKPAPYFFFTVERRRIRAVLDMNIYNIYMLEYQDHILKNQSEKLTIFVFRGFSVTVSAAAAL